LPRWLSILITLLIIIIIFLIIFTLIYSSISSFSEDAAQIKNKAEETLKKTQISIEKNLHINTEAQLKWLENNISSFGKTGQEILTKFVNSLATFITFMGLIPIYTFFMLYYRQVFKEFITMVSNDKTQKENANELVDTIIEVVKKYVVGLFTVTLIITVLNILGLWIIDIEHAIFFGSVAGLLTIIPYVGVFIGSSLPILFAFISKESIYYPLAVFVWFQAVQWIEGNFITPKVVGSQVSLNPLIAILALLIGAAVWGIPGMILFTPLTAIVKVILDSILATKPYGHLLGEGNKND